MSHQTALDLILCIIEGMLLFYFACHVLERRFKNLFVVICSIAIHSIVIFLINPAPVMVKMTISVALFFVLCVLNFKDQIIVTIGNVFYAFYIIVISDIVFADLISIIQKTGIYNTIASYDESTVIFSVVVKIINLALFYVSIKFFRKINKNSKAIYSVTLDIIFICFLCSSIIFASLYSIATYDPKNMTLLLILSLVFFVISFLILSLFVKLCDYFSREQYWTVTNIKYESLKNQMNLQQEFVESSNKLRHDFKKLLGTIGYLNSQKEYDSLTSFIEELSDDAYSYKPVEYCKNQYIDAILNIKLNECESKDIKLCVKASPMVECNIKSDDIVLIMSNLLDNAIEAVSKTSEEHKSVTIKIYNYESSLIISTENRYIPNTSKASFFQSEKTNRNTHGYGVKIINDLVIANNGQVDMEHHDGLFKATIIFPNE